MVSDCEMLLILSKTHKWYKHFRKKSHLESGRSCLNWLPSEACGYWLNYNTRRWATKQPHSLLAHYFNIFQCLLHLQTPPQGLLPKLSQVGGGFLLKRSPWPHYLFGDVFCSIIHRALCGVRGAFPYFQFAHCTRKHGSVSQYKTTEMTPRMQNNANIFRAAETSFKCAKISSLLLT